MATEENKMGNEGMDVEIPDIPTEVRELQTELINLDTRLVFAVATCECENKEECDVYKNSKEIAKILKKLQDVITVIPREKGSKKQKKSQK